MERNKRIRKKMKKQSGITLVALVVTIVILIILATISINIIFEKTNSSSTSTGIWSFYKEVGENKNKY